MATREHVELPFEYRNEAQVTVLSRTDGDVLVPLVSFLSSEPLSAIRMSLDLLPQLFNFGLVVLQAGAEMVLHFIHLRLWWEQVKQILYLEDSLRLSANNSESIFHTLALVIRSVAHRCLLRGCDGVLEELLGDPHPQFLFGFNVLGFVSVDLSQVNVFAVEGKLDSLVVEVEDAVQDDLRLLH